MKLNDIHELSEIVYFIGDDKVTTGRISEVRVNVFIENGKKVVEGSYFIDSEGHTYIRSLDSVFRSKKEFLEYLSEVI